VPDYIPAASRAFWLSRSYYTRAAYKSDYEPEIRTLILLWYWIGHADRAVSNYWAGIEINQTNILVTFCQKIIT
jgi:hypothetical protein